jgi:hypothetical protein
MGYLGLTVICYKDSGGGAISKAGDQYQIHKVLIAVDQSGRGQGDLITRTTPINSAIGIVMRPHQALEPTYSWNDKYTPTNASANVGSGTGNILLQRTGRDHYNNTLTPGYRAYTYPHPLVSGAHRAPTNRAVAPSK